MGCGVKAAAIAVSVLLQIRLVSSQGGEPGGGATTTTVTACASFCSFYSAALQCTGSMWVQCKDCSDCASYASPTTTAAPAPPPAPPTPAPVTGCAGVCSTMTITVKCGFFNGTCYACTDCVQGNTDPPTTTTVPPTTTTLITTTTPAPTTTAPPPTTTPPTTTTLTTTTTTTLPCESWCWSYPNATRCGTTLTSYCAGCASCFSNSPVPTPAPPPPPAATTPSPNGCLSMCVYYPQAVKCAAGNAVHCGACPSCLGNPTTTVTTLPTTTTVAVTTTQGCLFFCKYYTPANRCNASLSLSSYCGGCAECR
mmetsp:Transcript_87953/g.244065  ORF Transcript_87953/g.244065 Transcript_87953/m.244065 type:complete len:310 (-) Transcript_87953:201-1130(-)